jgi:hypothetical protein
VDTIPKIILQNPFRILGVYANSAKRDVVANKGKATAFLKVNRPVEFPLDLKGILPPINRTLELMNDAEAHLSIAKEQIKYAQFWFLNLTKIDTIAFNHLLAGDMDRAKEIWSKQNSLSSLQNKLVCYLIEENPRAAVIAAEMLYKLYGDDYIKRVDANCTLQMTGSELLNQFLDSLSEDVDIQKLLGYITDVEAKAYIRNQSIEPLINKISIEVDKTKKVDHRNPKARLEAARKLITDTRDAFSQLKGILPITDPKFQMIADKLGIEILQCGIDYFNNSDDDDSPQTAMKVQKYALSIVVGTMAKQRCEENVRTLQEIIDQLPPKEIMVYDKAIKAELSKFVKLPDKISHAITLLNNTRLNLQSIKIKLGSTNAYYLKLSTQIVRNALHNVIEEVNQAQAPLAEYSKMLEKMSPSVRATFLSGNRGFIQILRETQDDVKSTLREAWQATLLMDSFDMEPGFRSHYNENKSTLKSMCDNAGVIRTSATSRPSTIPSSSYSSSSSSRPSTAYNSSSSSSGKGGCVFGIIILVIAGIILFAHSNSKRSYASVSPAQKNNYTEVEETADSLPYEEDDVVLASSDIIDDSDEVEYIAEADNSYNEVHHSTGDRPYQSFYGRGDYDKKTENSLTIMNEYDRDAVVFLETTSGRKIRHVYINASNNFTMSNIPAGRYVVKIMQGTSWNPDKDNGPNAPRGGFMRDLSMSESGTSDIFEFPSVSSGQYGSYELTLYKVQNGNMSTHNIDNAAMFN